MRSCHEQAGANPVAEEYFKKAIEKGDRRLLLSTVPKGRKTMHGALLGVETAIENGVAEKLLAAIRVLPESLPDAGPAEDSGHWCPGPPGVKLFPDHPLPPLPQADAKSVKDSEDEKKPEISLDDLEDMSGVEYEDE